MEGAAHACVDRYCELATCKRSDLTKVPTPCIDDHLLPPEDFTTVGLVLKCLYLARLARPDLAWTINTQAREVTKWNVACDKRLKRLICYINSSAADCLYNYMGDPADKCKLVLFCDASFAGDLRDSKSTGGGILTLMGPSTFVVLSWVCKKQGAVSHSSSEAEIIAMDAAVRMEGLPAIHLWDLVIDTFSPIGANAPISKRPQETTLFSRQEPHTLLARLTSQKDYSPVPSEDNIFIPSSKIGFLVF